MTMAFTMFKDFRVATSKVDRVRALATLIMFFCAGGYVTSVLTTILPFGPDGTLPEICGASVAAIVGTSLKFA